MLCHVGSISTIHCITSSIVNEVIRGNFKSFLQKDFTGIKRIRKIRKIRKIKSIKKIKRIKRIKIIKSIKS